MEAGPCHSDAGDAEIGRSISDESMPTRHIHYNMLTQVGKSASGDLLDHILFIK